MASAAQGVIASPPVVVLDHRTRGGTLELFNPGTDSLEVELRLVFGYLVSDSTGQLRLSTIPSPPPGEPSAASWIDVFPDRVILSPGGRQTIRFLGRPPAGLPDGEYWSRIAVLSKRAARLPVRDSTLPRGVSAELLLNIESMLSLLYRKGTVHTGVHVGPLRASVVADSIVYRVGFTREGNAAWLGTVVSELVTEDGRVVKSHERPFSVYKPIEPRFVFELAGVPAGRYRLRVSTRSERGDVMPGGVLPAPASRDSVAIVLGTAH
jgi:hypothetical protein